MCTFPVGWNARNSPMKIHESQQVCFHFDELVQNDLLKHHLANPE
jgi:hypothetical protein